MNDASTRTLDPRLIPFTLTNEPLPDDLVPALNRHLTHLSQSISALDHQIYLLQQKRDETQNQKERYTALKSLARQLPPELIASIMYFATGEGTRPFGGEERGIFRSLQSVCSAWRRTALSTPELWTSLEVDLGDLPDSSEPTTSSFVPLVDGWISRAGSRPVTLSFHSNKPYASTEAAEADTMAVISYATRCEHEISSLCLGAGLFTNDNVIQALIYEYGQFKNVKHIFWNYPTHPTVLELPIGHPLDIRFPALEGFTLFSDIVRSPTLTHFAHSSLRHLSLRSVLLPASSFIRLIKGLDALEDLVLRDCFTTSDSMAPEYPAVHKGVKRLIVCGHPEIWILYSFTFPSLEFASIREQELFVDEPVATGFAQFIAAGDSGSVVGRGKLTIDLSHSTFHPNSPRGALELLSKIMIPYHLFLPDIQHLSWYLISPPLTSGSSRSATHQPDSLSLANLNVQQVVCRRSVPDTDTTELLSDWSAALSSLDRTREETDKLKVYIPGPWSLRQGIIQTQPYSTLNRGGIEVECIPEVTAQNMIYREYPKRWFDDPVNLEEGEADGVAFEDWS